MAHKEVVIMGKYIERPVRTKFVKLWASKVAPGSRFGITEVGNLVRLSLPAYVSPMGYGGQSVARILRDQCGWHRDDWSIGKPEAL